MTAPADSANGPLAGLRVLELGQVIAGTFSGLILSDLGAEVIKIEPPSGDLGRNPQVAPIKGRSSLFMTMNRGKKSLSIDLKNKDGRRVLIDLVTRSDVLIENFRHGVLQRLGFSYPDLEPINPGLIYCSVTGYSSAGNQSQLPSFDLIQQAEAGYLSITGEPGSSPARVGIPLADLSVAMFAVPAILAAIIQRTRTGAGQHIEVAMLDSLLFLLTYDATNFLSTGSEPAAWGSAHPYYVPWQAFKARDRWLVLAVREEKYWVPACSVLGLDTMAEDERFNTAQRRVENRDELVALLGVRFAMDTAEAWLAKFREAGVPAAPVREVGEALSDDDFKRRGGVLDVDDGLYSFRTVASPVRLGGRPQGSVAPPPTLGEHTREVLISLLNYSPDEVARLEATGAVRSEASDSTYNRGAF